LTQISPMLKNNFLFFVLVLISSYSTNAQYTETINSNRPGVSQGAFAVGRGVLQFETGLRYGQDEHNLLKYKTDLYGFDYSIRYGVFMEQLEFQFSGTYLYSNQTQTIGGQMRERSFSNFKSNFIGAKYLVYDPYKGRIFEKANIRSWKANRAFKWETLIPAISVYAGANILFGDNPYLPQNTGSLTPQAGIATQNNWGKWVFVMNFIADKFTEDIPTYSGVFTLTRTLSRYFSIFAEYQAIKSDFYSDDLMRGGAAYLFSDNLQVDLFGVVNFKDTPQRWQVGAGVSYRLDMHDIDEIIRSPEEKDDKEEDKKSKKEQREEMLEGGDDPSNEN